MYCPRCSQLQPTEDMRFCSSCGLQLTYINELVLSNGNPITPQMLVPRSGPLMRRKGVRIGSKVVFLGVCLLPLAMIASIVADSPGPLAIPAIVFLVGLAKVFYTLIFEEHDRLEQEQVKFAGPIWQQQPRFNNAGAPLSLDESRRVDTSQIVRPASVTEHTTRLLDENH